MAMAMHEGTKVPQSPAWRSFHKIVQMNLSNESDVKLALLANLCWQEVQDVHYQGEMSNFSESLTVGAQWAVKVLPSVSRRWPETSKVLYLFLVDAWMHTRDHQLEREFAETLISLPIIEQPDAAKVMRETLEFRYNSFIEYGLLERCSRLLVAVPNPNHGNEIARAAVKAVARYAPLFQLASIFKKAL